MARRTLVHLSSKQEALHASLLEVAGEKATGIPTSRYPPIVVHAYPFVPVSPPFPFEAGAPIDHASGRVGTIDPHLRSANNLAYTRTLELLRRELGPHFPLEELWEKHTYYVSFIAGVSLAITLMKPRDARNSWSGTHRVIDFIAGLARC